MDNTDAVRDFNNKLQHQWYRQAVCGQRFVQVDELTDWMRTNSQSGETNASRLLTQVMDHHPRRSFWNDLLTVMADQDACLLVFAILLELDHGDLIDVFLELRIRDKSLPILSDNQKRFNKRLRHHNLKNAEIVVDQFSKLQWSYCPVKLKLGMQGRFDAHESGSRVLPFRARQRVNDKGGTAEIWEVSVEGDMMDSDLREAISETSFAHQQYNRCYQIAIKSFRKEYEDIFEREKQAFIALKNQQGMIQYLGSFTHQDASGEETHNLLLEYGERDLIEFFSEHQSPVQPLEIIRFWEQLLKVAQALKRMHVFPYPTPAGSSRFYYGWHSDIKPDNILRVRGEYKLADFGFSSFKEKKAGDSDKTPETKIEGHTMTYGPPEIDCGRIQSHQFGQGIDIWSLGAVLSMAATWVVHGAQGIEQFQELRERDIKNLRAQRDMARAWNTPSADDSFHDGNSVLGSVLKWHQYLRLTVRTNDFVTIPVLDLIEEFMLLQDPNNRIKSEELCGTLQSLLKKARSMAKNPALVIDETVLGTILSLDKKETIQQKLILKLSNQKKTTSGSRTKHGKPIDRLRQFHVSKLAHPEVLQDGLDEAAKNAWNRHRLPPIEVDKSLDLTHPMRRTGPSASRRSRAQVPFQQEQYQSPSQVAETTTESTKPTVTVNTNYDGKEVSMTPAPISAASMDAVGMAGRASPLATRYWPPSNAPLIPATGPGSPIPECYSLNDVHPGLDVHRVRTELSTSRKGFMNKLLKKSKKNEAYRDFINNRDIKFIVDNGITMRKYWKAATFTLATLSMMVAALDEDGVDLHFTMSHDHNLSNVREKNLPSKFENAMDKAQPPFARPQNRPCETDMNAVLGGVFREYLDQLSIRRSRSKCMTLIILTDGIWGGTIRKLETLEDKIGKFIKSVSNIRGEMEERQFSIEFVAFGDSPEAIQLLRELDDKSCKRLHIGDMIDTEHWTGQVHKMILGSIRDDMDEEEGGDSSMSPRTAQNRESLFPHSPSTSNTWDVASQHIVPSSSRHSEHIRRYPQSQFWPVP